MSTSLPRRDLLLSALFLPVVPWAPGSGSSWRGAPSVQASDAAPEGFPSQDPASIREVVGAAHGDVDRVRELVTARPALAKAAWDWGYGDWESALGAAAHTGHRDIAELLLAHGARPTLFSAAMLGQLDVVRAFVEASPGVQATPGPHGIPLLAHARAGGAAAAPVVDYLLSVGGPDFPTDRPPLPEDPQAVYGGTYAFGAGETDRLVVSLHERFGVRIERPPTAIPRALRHLGEHTFHPTGSPAVRIRFEVVAGRARSLTVSDPEPIVYAERVDG